MVNKITRHRSLVLASLALATVMSCGARPDTNEAVAPLTTSGTGIETSSTTSTDKQPAPVGASVTGTSPVPEATPGPGSPATKTAPTGVNPAPAEPVIVVTLPSSPPETNPTTPVVTTPAGPVIDWAYVSANFFKANCLRCHAAPGNAGDINLETYANAKTALDLIKNEVLVEKSMPPRKTLPAATIAVLKAWLDAGAPEIVAP